MTLRGGDVIVYTDPLKAGDGGDGWLEIVAYF